MHRAADALSEADLEVRAADELLELAEFIVDRDF